jgi:hypothetical protein
MAVIDNKKLDRFVRETLKLMKRFWPTMKYKSLNDTKLVELGTFNSEGVQLTKAGKVESIKVNKYWNSIKNIKKEIGK